MAGQGNLLEPVFSNAHLQAQGSYHAPSMHSSLPFPALLIVLHQKFPAVKKLSAVDGAYTASSQCFLNSVSERTFHALHIVAVHFSQFSEILPVVQQGQRFKWVSDHRKIPYLVLPTINLILRYLHTALCWKSSCDAECTDAIISHTCHGEVLKTPHKSHGHSLVKCYMNTFNSDCLPQYYRSKRYLIIDCTS